MEIFDYNNKINFVDENNVFVGYDMHQDCCEHCFWWICEDWTRTKKLDDCKKIIEGTVEELNEKLKGFVFNTNFFRQFKDERCDEGGAVVFKLMKNNKRIYLILENHHNGYYSHGFKFVENDELIQDGHI